ncbi:MAG TPA: cytochrome c oxidase assembly protein, partial [Acidimicrobiales bacterium]
MGPPPLGPEGFDWTSWQADPGVVTGLVVLGTAYAGATLWRQRLDPAARLQPRRIAAFAGALLVLLVALTGPIHDLSDYYLFSAHMVQHMLLVFAMPPLLLYGTPGWMLRPLLRDPKLLQLGRLLTRPAGAFATGPRHATGDGGDARHAPGNGRSADLVAVGAGGGAGRGVDDEVDLAVVDPVDHVRRALADLVEPLDRDAHPRDRRGGAAGGDDPEPEVVQQGSDPHHRRLVGVGDGEEDGPAARQPRARRGLRLREGGREVGGHAHHLAGRAHLRPEQGVGAGEAVEREDRLLDRDMVATGVHREVEVDEPLPQHHAA